MAFSVVAFCQNDPNPDLSYSYPKLRFIRVLVS